MKKEFNITGVCYPHLHYMMDNSAKIAEIMDMVERGKYFTINRPRQYGKTTALFFLTEALAKREGYVPIRMNFQGIDEQWHESDGAFARMFVGEMQKALKFVRPELSAFLNRIAAEGKDMNSLSSAITELVHQTDDKLVLLIDEADASSNFFPFLNFLGMLRTKYLDRFSPQHATFHSIVLAGVHDIKTLKAKVRPDDKAHYNSPWNIATDFEVDMSFHPKEIAPMLLGYSQAEGVEMDVAAIAGKLYYYTSGYPFLVSKLCKIVAEKIIPKKSEEKRLDIAITYFHHKYVIELKRWYGNKTHRKGLDQLSDYLSRQHLKSGYLIIFEHRTEKTWRQEHIRHGDKNIFAVWV